MKVLQIDNVCISSDEPEDTWDSLIKTLEKAVNMAFKTKWFVKKKEKKKK